MISCFSKGQSPLHLSLLFALLFLSPTIMAQEVKASSVAAYPNPSKGLVFIKSEIPLKGLEIVLITETNGRVIHGYEIEISGNSMKIDFHNHPSGEYFVHLLFDDSSEMLRIHKL